MFKTHLPLTAFVYCLFLIGAMMVLWFLIVKLTSLASSRLTSRKAETMANGVSKVDTLSKARSVSDWAWSMLTWTVFAAGYLAKALMTPSNALVSTICFVMSDRFGVYLALIFVAASLAGSLTCSGDYAAFLALGPGGTPSTFSGFKRITLLAWFGRIDVLTAPEHCLGPGFLSALPARNDQRPIVRGIAPQRQLDQRNSKDVFDHLLTNLDHFASKNASHLHTGKSFLEKMTQAVFAHCDCVNMPLFRTFGCEITHPHHVDGSLHVMLHPEDIKTAIDCGWGERHPIARANSWWISWFATFEGRPPVPENLVFVYAPRTYEEVSIVMTIVEAGALFVADNEKILSDGHSGCANHHPCSR